MRAGLMDFEIIDGVEEAEDTRCEARQENHIELKQPTLAEKPQSNREGVTEGEEEDGRYSCGILLHREGSLTVKGRGEDEEANHDHEARQGRRTSPIPSRSISFVVEIDQGPPRLPFWQRSHGWTTVRVRQSRRCALSRAGTTDQNGSNAMMEDCCTRRGELCANNQNRKDKKLN